MQTNDSWIVLILILTNRISIEIIKLLIEGNLCLLNKDNALLMLALKYNTSIEKIKFKICEFLKQRTIIFTLINISIIK